MHSAERRRGVAVVLQFGCWIDSDTEVTGDLRRVFVGFNRAEWGIDFHMLAILSDVAVGQEAMGEEGEAGDAENSDADDHGEDDQDNFEGAAAAG